MVIVFQLPMFELPMFQVAMFQVPMFQLPMFQISMFGNGNILELSQGWKCAFDSTKNICILGLHKI